MNRRRVLFALVPLLAYALMVGCKSSSSTSTPTPSHSTGATATGQLVQSPDASVQAIGGPVYDIKLSGGLTAEWKSGIAGTSASCTLAEDGYGAMAVNGQIDGKAYGFGFSQNQFAAGTYTYPYAQFQTDEPPFIQVTTSTDSSVDWTAGSVGLGSGTATAVGARGSEVVVTLNVDLTPRAGGTVVHAFGTLNCPAS